MESAEQLALSRLHQQRQAALSVAVSKRITLAARAADVRDIDAWWARVGPTLTQFVQRGSHASALLTAEYLRTHALLGGVRLTPELYAAVLEQVATSMQVTGPVAFKTAMARLGAGGEPSAAATMAQRLGASSSRLVLAGQRGTIAGAVRDGKLTGYRRVSDGKPCHFCAMLIGRGAVYSAETADFHAHDGDGCRPEPLYAHEPEPDAVLQLQQAWADATRGKSGADALNAWRSHWATV